MEKEPSTNEVSRRDFLELGLYAMSGLCLSVSTIGLLGMVKFTYSLGDFQDLEDSVLGAVRFKATEFDHLSSLESCVNRGRAFMIIHKDYLFNGFDQGYRNQYYPDYPEYQQNIGQLTEYLRISGEPTFLAVETESFRRGIENTTNFSVCTSLIITLNRSGRIAKYVHTKSGLREQDIPRIATFFERSGVHTLCFAGEQAWYEEQEEGACLTIMASHFMDDFDIKGVEGCVYPMCPPSAPTVIQKELYFDTIPIPSI